MQLADLVQFFSKPLVAKPGVLTNDVTLILKQRLNQLLNEYKDGYYIVSWLDFPEIIPFPTEPLTPKLLFDQFSQLLQTRIKNQLEIMNDYHMRGELMNLQRLIMHKWRTLSYCMGDNADENTILLKSFLLTTGMTHAGFPKNFYNEKYAMLGDVYSREGGRSDINSDATLVGLFRKTFQQGPKLYIVDEIPTTTVPAPGLFTAKNPCYVINTFCILIPEDVVDYLKKYIKNVTRYIIDTEKDPGEIKFFANASCLFSDWNLSSISLRDCAAKHHLRSILVPSTIIQMCLRQLGHVGRLPTKEAMLDIIFTTIYLKTDNLLMFIPLNSNVNYKELRFNDHRHESMLINDSFSPDFSNMLREIDKQLATVFVHSTVKTYYLLLKDLIADLLLEPLTDAVKNLALSTSIERLESIIHNLGLCTTVTGKFYKLVEYAIDEIQMMLRLANKYTLDESAMIISDYFKSLYDYEDIKDVISNGFMLSSGMHAITLALGSMIEDVKSKNSEFVIALSRGSYFEIEMVLYGFFDTKFIGRLPKKLEKERLTDLRRAEGLIISDDINHHEYFRIDNTGALSVVVENDLIVDILVASFLQNVNLDRPGFNSYDVVQNVKKQLNLRQERGSERGLMLLVDTVMSGYDNIYQDELLSVFADELASGRLMVTFAHSLNKYDQLGLDKLGSGAQISFYNPGRYPVLHTNFLVAKSSVPCDATLQLTTHFLKHSRPYLISYVSQMIGVSRYIHDYLIPRSLYNTTGNQLISIDIPYSNDIFKDYWSFVTIRFNSNFPKEIISLATGHITHHCLRLRILKRDGYGFSTSTMVPFVKASDIVVALRISLGAETLDVLHEKFLFISKLFSHINEIVKCSDPEHMADERKKIMLDLLAGYLKKVVKGFPPDDTIKKSEPESP